MSSDPSGEQQEEITFMTFVPIIAFFAITIFLKIKFNAWWERCEALDRQREALKKAQAKADGRTTGTDSKAEGSTLKDRTNSSLSEKESKIGSVKDKKSVTATDAGLDEEAEFPPRSYPDGKPSRLVRLGHWMQDNVL